MIRRIRINDKEKLMSLERLEKKIDDIRIILLGNGRIGLVAKVQLLWENKKTRMGLLDWCFRIIILTVISFVAVKVGLK